MDGCVSGMLFQKARFILPCPRWYQKPDFPIYAVDVSTTKTKKKNDETDKGGRENSTTTRMAVGGGRDGGFLGVSRLFV